MKKWLVGPSKKGEQKKKAESGSGGAGEKQDDFIELDGCLMIFGGPATCKSKRKQKVTRQEVFAAEPATPVYLRWSESAITFDRADHPNIVPQPGRCPWYLNQSSAPSI